MRINIIKDMILHKDHTSLAALHDGKLDTCYLHQGKLNNHRLVECNKFLQLAKGSGDLVKDMKRKITTGFQRPHGSARRAQSEGGTNKYCSASALAAAEAFDEEVARIDNLETDTSYLPSTNSSSPSNITPLPVGHFNISHSKTAISDTGATDHMSGVRSLFSKLFSFQSEDKPMISLGDDSVIPAEGWGLLDYIENGKRIRRVALYVPQLGDNTLISITRHIQYLGCWFHAEDNCAEMSYPSHQCKLGMSPELHSTVQPTEFTQELPDFDETIAPSAGQADFATSLLPSSVLDYVSSSSATSFVKTALFHPLHSGAIMPSSDKEKPLTILLPSPIILKPNESKTLALGCKLKLPEGLTATLEATNLPSFKAVLASSSVGESSTVGLVVRLTNQSSQQLSVPTIGQIVVSDHHGPLSLFEPPSSKETTALPSEQKSGFFHLGKDDYVFFDNSQRKHKARRVSFSTQDEIINETSTNDKADIVKPSLFIQHIDRISYSE